MLDSLGFRNFWKDPEPFQYASSIGQDSIRLLRVKPSGLLTFGQPKLELLCETFPLEKLPDVDYFALSYTWGPSNAQGAAYTDTDKCKLLINGGIFDVYPNLFDALCEMRTFFIGYPVYVWIDALCINQNDVAERASQVNIMDRIYKHASYTLVWLGKPTSPNEEEAVDAIFKPILDIAPAEIREMARQYPAQPFLPPNSPKHYGLPGREKSHLWLAVHNFFCQRWFDRVWIIQEVALSKKILVLWGQKRIEWDAMQHIAAFLCRATKLSHLLQGQVAGMNGPIDPVEKFYSLCLLREQCQDEADVDYNRRKTLSETILRATGNNSMQPASLTMAFALGNKSFQATDPRDKIFAFIGIVNHLFTVDGLNDQRGKITADYSDSSTSPAAAVYARITARAIIEAQSLSVILTQSDAPDSKLGDLPSWCPDLSISAGTSGFMDIRPIFNACNRDSGETHRRLRLSFQDDDRRLGVSAIVLAQVSSLGVGNEGLRHAPILSLAKFLLEQAPTYAPTGQNRVEAFWRTLIMDAAAVTSPASWSALDSRDPFHSYILTQLWKEYSMEYKKSDISLPEWRRSYGALDELAEADDTGHMPSTLDFERDFGEMGRLAALQSTDEPIEVTEVQKMLRDSFRAKIEAWSHSIEDSFAKKRFAVSSEGHFLLVPEWTKEEDTLAIVDGCPCPVILRPHVTDARYWIMVGPAYAHGIMYGEAVLDDEEKWQKIWIC